MDVQEYVREDGSNPYRDWFDGLDKMAASKVAIAESRLTLGNTSNVKWFAEQAQNGKSKKRKAQ